MLRLTLTAWHCWLWQRETCIPQLAVKCCDIARSPTPVGHDAVRASFKTETWILVPRLVMSVVNQWFCDQCDVWVTVSHCVTTDQRALCPGHPGISIWFDHRVTSGKHHRNIDLIRSQSWRDGYHDSGLAIRSGLTVWARSTAMSCNTTVTYVAWLSLYRVCDRHCYATSIVRVWSTSGNVSRWACALHCASWPSTANFNVCIQQLLTLVPRTWPGHLQDLSSLWFPFLRSMPQCLSHC